MSRIALSVAALFVLAAVPNLFVAAANFPRASGTPNCFVCPPTDALGFALGVNNVNNGIIFCSYPAVEGEDPNDFFCTYNEGTGALVTDNDAGLCNPTAVQTACITRRDDNFKAMQRRVKARVAKAQTTSPEKRAPIRRKEKFRA